MMTKRNLSFGGRLPHGAACTAACAALVPAALLLAAGCGSSGSGTTGAPGATGASSSTGTAATPPKAGSTGATAAATPTKAGSTGGGLKVNTTPKYASPSPSEPVKSGVVQIAYRNIAIDPDTVRVKVGATIRWTNHDPVEHNVTSKGGPISFASGNFGEGKTVEFKMTKPGIVHYMCTIHPATMNGTIEVVK